MLVIYTKLSSKLANAHDLHNCVCSASLLRHLGKQASHMMSVSRHQIQISGFADSQRSGTPSLAAGKMLLALADDNASVLFACGYRAHHSPFCQNNSPSAGLSR